MILQATYPQKQFSITNNFFYSPLKRRLAMLTKNNNPKINYLSRLLVLALAALVFFAFTLKLKTNNANHYTGKRINVVIDAGHGGSDKGAMMNNIDEKNITLALAREINELNKNENIKIILTRNADSAVSVQQRVRFAKDAEADLFISIHLDAEANKNNHSGMSVFIPGTGNLFFKESNLLGSDIIESFKNNYKLPVDDNLKQREKGIRVLNANECAAVLTEPGFLTTDKDLEYLIKPDNQKKIAQNILKAIEKYAFSKELTTKDAIPKEGSGTLIYNSDFAKKNVLQNNTEDEITTTKGDATTYSKTNKDITLSNNTITPTNPGYIEMKADTFIIQDKEQRPSYRDKDLLIMNGKVVNRERILNKLITAKELKVYPKNNEEAIKLYGEVAKNGVTVFTNAVITDKTKNETTDTIPDRIFTKTEIEASFPGGTEAWARYILKVIQTNTNDLLKSNISGTCRVKFVIDKDGSVSDVTAISMQTTKLSEVAVSAIRKGPKWIPAIQNGHMVASYKEIPITFKIDDRLNVKNEPN